MIVKKISLGTGMSSNTGSITVSQVFRLQINKKNANS
jgi:hypothetical protein